MAYEYLEKYSISSNELWSINFDKVIQERELTVGLVLDLIFVAKESGRSLNCFYVLGYQAFVK